MKKILLRTLLIGGLAAGALTATMAIAGPGGGGHPIARLMAVADEIGLTEAQKTQIEGIVESRKAEAQALRSDGRKVHKALDGAIEAGADNDTIAGLAIEAHQLRSDGKDLRREVKKQVGAVLTADQKDQLKQMRAERHGDGDGKGRRGEGRGKGRGGL